MGGRDDSRFALWRTNAAQEQRLHCCRYPVVGARHRREHGYLSIDRCRATAYAARQSAARTNRSAHGGQDRKSTRLNSSHSQISYAVFCLKKKKKKQNRSKHNMETK